MLILDIDKNIIQRIKKPNGSGGIKISKNGENIYYLNSSGIYKLVNGESEFSLLVNSFGLESISDIEQVSSFYVDKDEKAHIIKNVMDYFEYFTITPTP